MVEKQHGYNLAECSHSADKKRDSSRTKWENKEWRSQLEL